MPVMRFGWRSIAATAPVLILLLTRPLGLRSLTAGERGAETGDQGSADSAVDIGRAIYDARCVNCHGATGKGDGPAAELLNPRPRDLTSGKFTIRTTESGSLPTDDDLRSSISNGFAGTSMPAWRPFI